MIWATTPFSCQHAVLLSAWICSVFYTGVSNSGPSDVSRIEMKRVIQGEIFWGYKRYKQTVIYILWVKASVWSTYLVTHEEHLTDQHHYGHVVGTLHERIVSEDLTLNHREEYFNQSLEWFSFFSDFKFKCLHDRPERTQARQNIHFVPRWDSIDNLLLKLCCWNFSCLRVLLIGPIPNCGIVILCNIPTNVLQTWHNQFVRGILHNRVQGCKDVGSQELFVNFGNLLLAVLLYLEEGLSLRGPKRIHN